MITEKQQPEESRRLSWALICHRVTRKVLGTLPLLGQSGHKVERRHVTSSWKGLGVNLRDCYFILQLRRSWCLKNQEVNVWCQIKAKQRVNNCLMHPPGSVTIISHATFSTPLRVVQDYPECSIVSLIGETFLLPTKDRVDTVSRKLCLEDKPPVLAVMIILFSQSFSC